MSTVRAALIEADLASGAGLMHAALATAVEGARDLLGAARVAVFLPDSGSPRSVARRGFTADAAGALAAALAADDAAAVLVAGECLASGRGGPWTAGLARWLACHGDGSLLAVPLMGTGSPPGVLALGFSGGAQVTTARARAAERFAATLAVAIAASRRAVELERAARQDELSVTAAESGGDPHLLAEYERQVQFARALTDVLAATSEASDVATAGNCAGQILLRVMPGVEYAAVWVLDEDVAHLRRVAVVGATAPVNDAPEYLPVDEGISTTETMKTGRPVVWEGDQSGWPERLQAFAQRHDLATVAHVPMHSGGRVVGTISLYSRQARTYTTAEFAFLTTLAGQLGGQLDVVRERAKLEDERRRLASVLDTMPEGLLILGRDGRVRMFNQAALDLLGSMPEEPFDRHIRRYAVRPSGARHFISADQIIAPIMQGQVVQGLEFDGRRPDGAEIPFLASAAPILTPDGQVDAIVLVFQDISRLRELDRLKDDFINTVSHELRTPTTTIRGGALTLLRRGDRLDEEVRRQLLRDIAEESERLHHLVEDLLSLSRSQAGMQMTPEPLRLHRVVSKSVIDLGSRLGSYPLTIDVPPDLPVVEADPLALEQVLRNLLENAVRHSPRAGRVEITAEATDTEVVVSLLDRGAGLDAEDLDRIFEPFYRSPAAVHAGIQGAGLGLAVCRRLIVLSGGRIWAEQRPGGGAAFRFTLPRAIETDE